MLLQNRVHVLSFIQGNKVVYIRKIHPYELIFYTCLFSIGSTSSITEIRMTFPCNPCLLLRSVSAEVITKGSSLMFLMIGKRRHRSESTTKVDWTKSLGLTLGLSYVF